MQASKTYKAYQDIPCKKSYEPYKVSLAHKRYVMTQCKKFEDLGHSRSEALLEAWRDSWMHIYQSKKHECYFHITFQRMEKYVNEDKPRFTNRIISEWGNVDGFFDHEFIYLHKVNLKPYAIARIWGYWKKEDIDE